MNYIWVFINFTEIKVKVWFARFIPLRWKKSSRFKIAHDFHINLDNTSNETDGYRLRSKSTTSNLLHRT